MTTKEDLLADPVRLWKDATAERVIAAHDAMPKVARAWEDLGYVHGVCRIALLVRDQGDVDGEVTVAFLDDITWRWCLSGTVLLGDAPTLEAAQAAADAALLAAGWLLEGGPVALAKEPASSTKGTT